MGPGNQKYTADMVNSNLTMEKLKGKVNFSLQKFGMKIMLEFDDLLDAMEDEKKGPVKNRKVLAKKILYTNPINYPHSQCTKTAKHLEDYGNNL